MQSVPVKIRPNEIIEVPVVEATPKELGIIDTPNPSVLVTIVQNNGDSVIAELKLDTVGIAGHLTANNGRIRVVVLASEHVLVDESSVLDPLRGQGFLVLSPENGIELLPDATVGITGKSVGDVSIKQSLQGGVYEVDYSTPPVYKKVVFSNAGVNIKEIESRMPVG